MCGQEINHGLVQMHASCVLHVSHHHPTGDASQHPLSLSHPSNHQQCDAVDAGGVSLSWLAAAHWPSPARCHQNHPEETHFHPLVTVYPGSHYVVQEPRSDMPAEAKIGAKELPSLPVSPPYAVFCGGAKISHRITNVSGGTYQSPLFGRKTFHLRAVFQL